MSVSVTAPTTEVVGFYGFSTNALPPQCNFFITIPLSLFHFYGICYYTIWLFNNINGIVLNGIHPTTEVVGFLPVRIVTLPCHHRIICIHAPVSGILFNRFNTFPSSTPVGGTIPSSLAISSVLWQSHLCSYFEDRHNPHGYI